jgi:hypothetical protein
VLLGIKYEAAKIGEVGDATLAGIEEQMKREVGAGWESDDRVIRGRNAVRREHGLPGLGDLATGLLRSPPRDVRCGAGSLESRLQVSGFRFQEFSGNGYVAGGGVHCPGAPT